MEHFAGLACADSEEKHEPVSDIDTAPMEGLKALDPKRPIRDQLNTAGNTTSGSPKR